MSLIAFIKRIVGKFAADIVWKHVLRDLVHAHLVDALRVVAREILDKLGLRRRALT